MDYKVVFTDNSPDKLDIENQILSEVNTQVVDAEQADKPVIDVIRNADGIISSQFEMDEEIIESLERCQVISRTGIGVDYIDVDAATDHGIIVANVTDHCIDEVADHALGFIIALNRHMLPHHEQVLDGLWERTRFPVQRLDEQTLGLVAFGSIARALNERAQALGMDVLAYHPHLGDEEIESKGAIPADLDTLARQSDVISLHAPLNDETENMIDGEFLSKVQSGSYLINTARGGLVDEDALIDALESGVLEGAGLDVFRTEPLSEGHPLRERDDVFLTPHVGYYSEQSKTELRHRCAENVLAVLNGNIPDRIVNPDVTR